MSEDNAVTNDEEKLSAGIGGGSTSSGVFNRQEVVEMARKDVNFLAAIAMPTIFEFQFPPILVAIWGLLVDKVSIDGVFRQLIGLPRGHAKTTLIKLFCLWCVLFSDRQFILIICANSDKAENFLADVWGYLAEPNIINIWGNASITAETDTLTEKVFTFLGRPIVLKAVGQGSVRGINIRNLRPDMIIFDDVQDKENAESDTESQKLLQWIQSTAMKLRSPRRCLFIFIGNKYRVTGNCICILERMQKNPSWTSIVTGAILNDGQPLWPELHPLESLMDEFQNDLNMGTPEVFLSEIMNDTESSLHSLIDVSKVPENPYEDRSLCQGRFVIIDVATNKIGADDTAIGLFGIYPHLEGKEHVAFEGLLFGSLSPKETIREAFKICFATGANCICVESVAYQSSLLFWFQEVADDLKIEGIHFLELPVKGKKTGRILTVLKQMMKGELFLGMEVRAAVFKQALAFKPNKTNNRDDILDMAEKWQFVMTNYRFLVEMPHTVLAQAPGKFFENTSSF